jgi:hypothetical protein
VHGALGADVGGPHRSTEPPAPDPTNLETIYLLAWRGAWPTGVVSKLLCRVAHGKTYMGLGPFQLTIVFVMATRGSRA